MAYVDILILRNLVARPAHGYEIKKGVERVLGGAFAINNNVLYPALRRFEEIGAIEKRSSAKRASRTGTSTGRHP